MIYIIALILLSLTACSGDVAPIADDDLVDVGQLETFSDVAAVDAAVDSTAVDVDDVGQTDSAPETSPDVPPADTRETCVKRCLEPAGVPLGYFCSKGSDCCSGNCAPPDNRCAPPVDPAGWSECGK
jgi:hypothetical protein